MASYFTTLCHDINIHMSHHKGHDKKDWLV